MEYVIFLDDELELITNCVNLIEDYFPEKHEAKIFNDIVECFEFIEKNLAKINYIFVDCFMPEIDGVNFLCKVSEVSSHINGYILASNLKKIEEIKCLDYVKDVIEKDVNLAQNILKVLKNK